MSPLPSSNLPTNSLLWLPSCRGANYKMGWKLGKWVYKDWFKPIFHPLSNRNTSYIKAPNNHGWSPPVLLAQLWPCCNPYTVKWLLHVPLKQCTYLLSFFHISFGTPTVSFLYGMPGMDFGTSFAANSCCFWRSRPVRPQNSRCCSRRGPCPMALPHPFEVRDSNFVALSPPAVTTTRSANSPCSMAHYQQIRQMELFYCYKWRDGSKKIRHDKLRKFLLY